MPLWLRYGSVRHEYRRDACRILIRVSDAMLRDAPHVENWVLMCVPSLLSILRLTGTGTTTTQAETVGITLRFEAIDEMTVSQ